MSDLGLGKLLRAQPVGSLLELCFSGCKLLSDDTVQRVVGRAPQLRLLDLTRCPKAESGSKRELLTSRVLHFSSFFQGFSILFQTFPRLLTSKRGEFASKMFAFPT